MNLNTAYTIASKVHKGQKDINGEPCIHHTMRVLLKMNTEDERIVAALHDVIGEDGDFTKEDLWNAGFTSRILEAVKCLTHGFKEDYEVYIGRVASNPLAKTVKIADLEDNMTSPLIIDPSEKDKARLQIYQKAYLSLTGKNFPPCPPIA